MKIGEYELRHQLGQGGMAHVWLAQRVWSDGKRKVAVVKIPRTSVMVDARKTQMFLDEARLAMQLDHDNIVSVFDTGVHDGLPWLAMSYIPGRNVAELVREVSDGGSEFDFDVAAHVTRELGYALQYAHDFEIEGVNQEIVHRDVASKNVMISGSGGVLLTDFGVAHALSIESTGAHVKGTFRYMAPEHALGQATSKSDAFGMGTVLWELIEGREFRYDVEPSEMVRAALNGHITPLSRPGVPRALLEVVHGLLEVNERNRMHVTEAIERLEAFPGQRTVLKKMLTRYFGAEVRRSGHTSVEFQASAELDAAMKVVKITRVDASPLGGGPKIELRESEVRNLPRTDDISVPAALRRAPDVVQNPEQTAIEPHAPEVGRVAKTVFEPRIGEGVASANVPATERLPAPTRAAPHKPKARAILPPTAEREAGAPVAFSARRRRSSNAKKRHEPTPTPPSAAPPQSGTPVAPAPSVVPAQSSAPTPPHATPSTMPAYAASPTGERLVPGPARLRRGPPAWLPYVFVVVAGLLLSALVTMLWFGPRRATDPSGDAALVAAAADQAKKSPARTEVPSSIGSPAKVSPEPIEWELPDEPEPQAPAEPTPDDESTADSNEEAPAAEPQPKSKTATPKGAKTKVPVTITLGFVDPTQVRVAGRKRTLTRDNDRWPLSLSVGKYTVRWRIGDATSWGEQVFEAKAGHEHFLQIDGSGMKTSASKPRGAGR